MSVEMTIVAGKDSDFPGTFTDSTGAAIAITAGSDILFKAFRGDGATPDLDINGTQLTGGSVTNFVAGSGAGKGTYNVKFFGADTAALTPGTYDVEIDYVDAGDGNRLKYGDRGVLHILGNSLGKTT